MNDESRTMNVKTDMYKIIWAYFLAFVIFTLNACAPKPAAIPTPTEALLLLPETPTPAEPDCNSIKAIPTPGAEEESLFSPVSADDMTRGPADAAVTIIEYGDFQDLPSAALAPVLDQLEENYPEDLQIVYRDFPMVTNPGHEKAGHAARAAHAAALQGKYWEMHALLFAEQEVWSPLSGEEFERWLAEEAANLGMDAAQLVEDMQREEIVEKVRQAFVSGQEIGLPGTPFLLINGQIYNAPSDFASLDQIIRLIVLGERQFTSCPPIAINAAKDYLATLHTEKGDVVIQFYPDKAPVAVNNFIFLAQEGWFDGITFHRVLPGFVAQTGDPSGTGQGNPGYLFKNEIDSSLSFDRPGVVGMANSGADTNGSQFFITYAPVTQLDGKYTIFGQVISGMDVLEQLTPRDPQLGVEALPGDILLGVTIEER